MIENILEWSIEHGHDKEDSSKQILKLVEETGDIFMCYRDDEIDLIEDSLGDMYFDLIVLCQQLGIDLPETKEEVDAEVIGFLTLSNMSIELGILASFAINSSDDNKYIASITRLFGFMRSFAISYNWSLEDCLAKSYDKIKNRK